MATLKVTDDSFEKDVLQSDKLVLVDFWAEWCGPCKQIAPALEAVSEEYAGEVTIAKINIDDDPETASKFHVRAIPTLMIFKGGEVVSTRAGNMAQSTLSEWVGEFAGRTENLSS